MITEEMLRRYPLGRHIVYRSRAALSRKNYDDQRQPQQKIQSSRTVGSGLVIPFIPRAGAGRRPPGAGRAGV